MVGLLKYLGDETFCVEYEEQGIYVLWRPSMSSSAEKPKKWVDDAWPQREEVSETRLRDLIGSRANFGGGPRAEETKVEMRGFLEDGGFIVVGYVKGASTPALSEPEQQKAGDRLKAFVGAYLQSE